VKTGKAAVQDGPERVRQELAQSDLQKNRHRHRSENRCRYGMFREYLLHAGENQSVRDTHLRKRRDDLGEIAHQAQRGSQAVIALEELLVFGRSIVAFHDRKRI
jgi:hypothetical protein